MKQKDEAEEIENAINSLTVQEVKEHAIAICSKIAEIADRQEMEGYKREALQNFQAGLVICRMVEIVDELEARLNTYRK